MDWASNNPVLAAMLMAFAQSAAPMIHSRSASGSPLGVQQPWPSSLMLQRLLEQGSQAQPSQAWPANAPPPPTSADGLQRQCASLPASATPSSTSQVWSGLTEQQYQQSLEGKLSDVLQTVVQLGAEVLLMFYQLAQQRSGESTSSQLVQQNTFNVPPSPPAQRRQQPFAEGFPQPKCFPPAVPDLTAAGGGELPQQQGNCPPCMSAHAPQETTLHVPATTGCLPHLLSLQTRLQPPVESAVAESSQGTGLQSAAADLRRTVVPERTAQPGDLTPLTAAPAIQGTAPEVPPTSGGCPHVIPMPATSRLPSVISTHTTSQVPPTSGGVPHVISMGTSQVPPVSECSPSYLISTQTTSQMPPISGGLPRATPMQARDGPARPLVPRTTNLPSTAADLTPTVRADNGVHPSLRCNVSRNPLLQISDGAKSYFREYTEEQKRRMRGLAMLVYGVVGDAQRQPCNRGEGSSLPSNVYTASKWVTPVQTVPTTRGRKRNGPSSPCSSCSSADLTDEEAGSLSGMQHTDDNNSLVPSIFQIKTGKIYDTVAALRAALRQSAAACNFKYKHAGSHEIARSSEMAEGKDFRQVFAATAATSLCCASFVQVLPAH
ncbi:hypothetical protein CBR_g23798 [Chara braunii]|uniref:Uncharacterized protein n=1 Tax=Chara braunii TaxID=69332 RepID=A0A388JVQ1_CHABU|nr:hypothetical protein CBR_g23798 [Chara braunii]|eukprot:GBG61843.1 hypothetical protein CBR_g23798 [Chara braunii]